MRIYDWKKFLTFISIVLLLVIIILGCLIIKEDKLEIDHIENYKVQSGETLWEIGSKYRPEKMSIQEYIFNLKEHNKIGSMIYENQELEILIYREV